MIQAKVLDYYGSAFLSLLFIVALESVLLSSFVTVIVFLLILGGIFLGLIDVYGSG